jgi:hypothetical protein
VFIPHLDKTASITRTIKKPKQPEIVPNDASVKAAFAEAALHQEITLSRREIIKVILTESAQRSRLVQTLLKLDDIDQTRATLKTTENRLLAEQATAKAQLDAAQDSLKRHLDLASITTEEVLSAVNTRRTLLGLSPLESIDNATIFAEGAAQGHADRVEHPKESALADLAALRSAVSRELEGATRTQVNVVLRGIARLEADPSLVSLIKRHSFSRADWSSSMSPTAHCATSSGTSTNCERACVSELRNRAKPTEFETKFWRRRSQLLGRPGGWPVS